MGVLKRVKNLIKPTCSLKGQVGTDVLKLEKLSKLFGGKL